MFLLFAAAGLFADPPAKEIVVEAGAIKRLISLEPYLRTIQIINTATGDKLQPALDTPEFIVETVAGDILSTPDFRVTSADPRRITLERIGNDSQQLFITHRTTPDHLLIRRIELVGFGEVRRLVVEAMKLEARAELGGVGQPLFLNDCWFAGLEHPAGINRFDVAVGCMLLQQHPGSNQLSMESVLGGVASKEERLQDAFERHVNVFRRRPPQPTLQYNTWFDLRGPELTPRSAREAADTVHIKLLEPYDLRLQSFVLDDGWQEPKSLWEPRSDWKQGLSEFAQFLSAHRAGLGLWMPLNGASLDSTFLHDKGFPQTNHRKGCVCLSSSNYLVGMQNVLRNFDAQEGRRFVAFYKHDFNYLACSAGAHGHLPTPEHGREANVDGQIQLLTRDSSTVAPAASAVTSYAWPSPYWLKYTDYLWIGSYDYAEDWSVPCWSKRQAEMTFRDAQVYRLLRIDRAQVPMNALMTHGLIRGRHEGEVADRDAGDWADDVMMFLGRGAMLQELYVTPSLLSDEDWRILGVALRWAHRRADVLKHTRMIGGRPDNGEPYGYIHWAPDAGIACIRNPSPRPTLISLTSTERPNELPIRPRWNATRIYPDRQVLDVFESAKTWTLPLRGHEVAVIEFEPGSPIAPKSTQSPSITITRNEPDRLEWRFETTTKSDDQTEFVWWTEPDFGVVTSLKPSESVHTPLDLSGARWSLYHRPLDAGICQHSFSIKLPWSPFWPQEAKASVVVRTIRHPNDPDPDSDQLSAVDLPQMRPSHRSRIIDEQLVLDGWKFHRSRAWPERIFWVVILGLVPLAALGTAGRWIGNRTGWQKSVGIVAAALTLALYTLTPLGAALGRVLGEF